MADSGYSSLSISIDELPHVGLQRNFIYLRSAIDLSSMKDWLIQRNVISEGLKDKLENIGLAHLQNDKLIKYVIWKGKTASQEFLKCLREAQSGQCHIYEELKRRCLYRKLPPSGQHPSTTVTTQHLLTHKDFFLREIEPQYVTDLLFEAEAFSVDEHDEVIEKDLRMKKAEKLWKILYKKNDKNLLDAFVRTLEFCKCTDLLDVLRGEQRESFERRNAGSHLLLVQQNYRYVVENTLAEVLMHYLQAKNQLTDIEYATINQYKSRSKQTRLVKCVIARGDEACLCLIDGLMSPDHNRGDILTELLHRQSLRPGRRIPQVNLSNTCFRTHYEFLKQELEVDELIDVLLEELVLTAGDHNDVERCETRVRGAKHLIAILRKEPMEKFNTFVWALEHLKFKYIVDGLRKNAPVGRTETEVKAISTVEVHCNDFNNLASASNYQDVNIECTITASGDLREAVHEGIVSSLHDNTMEFETSVISAIEMEVENIGPGSVVIYIHPLTDDAVQQLISAKNSNRMNSFVQSIIKHANLSFIEAGEKIKLKVELGVRKPNDGRQRQIEQRKEKVSSADIECSIQENWDFLLDELEPRDLTQHYITKGMFREEECEDILSGEMSRRDQVGLFLQSIVLGGRGQALDFFVKLLKDHGLMHIIHKLRLEPKDDVHARAECIRKKITQNFSTLLEEVETPVISQTLKGCKNVTDTDKELLLPGGGCSRRTRVHEFLKMVLNNDRYVLEFEQAMADHGFQDLIKFDPSEVNTQSGPSQPVSHVASGTATRIFTGSFTITFQRGSSDEAEVKSTETLGRDKEDKSQPKSTITGSSDEAEVKSTETLGRDKEEKSQPKSTITGKPEEPRQFDAKKREKEYAEFLKNLQKKKSKRILVIGEQGVGKSSFINSAITAMTGKYESHAAAGLRGGGVSNVTVHLRSYTPADHYGDDMKLENTEIQEALPVFIDVIGFDDNLSNRLIQQTMGEESTGNEATEEEVLRNIRYGELENSVNSILIEFILRGRIPNRCNLLDFGREIINGNLEDLKEMEDLQEKEELKVDAVVMIIPRGRKNLPKKLLSTIKQETKRKDLDVPVFGVMSKMDMKEEDKEQTWRELGFDFISHLGIDVNHFVPLTNYAYIDLEDEKPDPSPNTDVPILKMLIQIYKTKAEGVILLSEKRKQKTAKEQREKDRKFGTVFIVSVVLVAAVLVSLAIIIGYVFYTNFTIGNLSTSFTEQTTSDTTPAPPTQAPKREL